MKIQYEDDYGEFLFSTNDGRTPRAGDHVVFNNEDFYVKSVSWIIQQDLVVITVSQNIVKVQEKDSTSGRLASLNNAIVETNKRLDKAEKKHGMLKEELVSVRTHLKADLRNKKKESE